MKHYILLALILLTGCTHAEIIYTPQHITTIIDQRVVENISKPDIIFCHADSCGDRLSNHILNSRNSVDCALFDLNLKKVIYAFQNTKAKVRVVADNNYKKKLHMYDFIKFDTKDQLTHNKFCIFDRSILWTGSFNPTENGDLYNDNNVILTDSKHLIANYNEEFKELWKGKFGNGSRTKHPVIFLNNTKVENYFCPEDDCENKVIQTLKTAEDSIYFMIFTFTSDKIGYTLKEKHKQGINIKGVIEKRQASGKYSEFNYLKKSGIDVIKDSNPKTMHHKVFIIDNTTTITGSYNPTRSATEKNDENILIIHDKEIARSYLDEFNRIWS